jgi:uncharacterized membrane protein
MDLKKRHFIEQVLSTEDREMISKAIHVAERQTSGEIKVVVREHRHLHERRLSLEKLALKEFHRLRLSKTKDQTGILFFLLLDERKFHIVADEGIHRKVSDGTWEQVAHSMSSDFRGGKFREGIVRGVEHVGRILSEAFPRRADDKNEISDRVIVE